MASLPRRQYQPRRRSCRCNAGVDSGSSPLHRRLVLVSERDDQLVESTRLRLAYGFQHVTRVQLDHVAVPKGRVFVQLVVDYCRQRVTGASEHTAPEPFTARTDFNPTPHRNLHVTLTVFPCLELWSHGDWRG